MRRKKPPKRVKSLVTPSTIFTFISSSSTGELCSQPITSNVRRTGRMFPEHVERSFSYPKYSFIAVRRTNTPNYIRPIKNQLYSPNTPNYIRGTNVRPVKNGPNALPLRQIGSAHSYSLTLIRSCKSIEPGAKPHRLRHRNSGSKLIRDERFRRNSSACSSVNV